MVKKDFEGALGFSHFVISKQDQAGTTDINDSRKRMKVPYFFKKQAGVQNTSRESTRSRNVG
jgi:hypothetical protein